MLVKNIVNERFFCSISLKLFMEKIKRFLPTLVKLLGRKGETKNILIQASQSKHLNIHHLQLMGHMSVNLLTILHLTLIRNKF
jgi:hypothetical protein